MNAARLIRVAAIAAALALGFWWLPRHAERTDVENLDFPVYYRAAVNAAQGLPVYADDPNTDPGPFLYPPTFAAALRPAASMSAHVFQHIAYTIVLLALSIYAIGLARLAKLPGRRSSRDGGFLVFLVLLVTPGVGHTLSYGNVDMLVWALVAWAFAVPALTPLLAVAAAIKVYPVFPLIVLLARNRRDQIGPTVGVGTLILFAALLSVEPAVFTEWWNVGLSTLTGGVFLAKNASLTIALLRPFGAAPRVLLVVLPLLITGVVAVAARRRSAEMHAALVMVAAVWAAPICWWYQLPVLLVPFAIWLKERSCEIS